MLLASSDSLSGVPLCGFGFAFSSVDALLSAATAQLLRGGLPLDRRKVLTDALVAEREAAGGIALAANDVAPIVQGGAVLVHTTAGFFASGIPVPGDTSVEPVSHDADWLTQHLAVAVNPDGARHNAPGLIERLVSHAGATRFIDRLTVLAEVAARAVRQSDIRGLASTMKEYVVLFDDWTDGVYTSEVREIIEHVEFALGSDVLAVKPPGAGAASALAFLLPDVDARDRVLHHLHSLGWHAAPGVVTHGVRARVAADGHVVSVGHRLDLIGAADLGADAHIARDGTSFAVAIEPRVVRFVPLIPPSS